MSSNNDACCTKESPLQAAIIAQDLATLDSEHIRIQNLINLQQCKIKDLEKQNCCLTANLESCETDKAIVTNRLRGVVGKFQSIQVTC